MLSWGSLPVCRWRGLGESLLAMYQHLTTCEPPRPSLGKRIDLLEYRDLEQQLPGPTPSAPVSLIQPTPVSASPVLPVAEPSLMYAPVTPSFPSPNMLEAGNPAGEPLQRKGCRCGPWACFSSWEGVSELSLSRSHPCFMEGWSRPSVGLVHCSEVGWPLAKGSLLVSWHPPVWPGQPSPLGLKRTAMSISPVGPPEARWGAGCLLPAWFPPGRLDRACKGELFLKVALLPGARCPGSS